MPIFFLSLIQVWRISQTGWKRNIQINKNIDVQKVCKVKTDWSYFQQNLTSMASKTQVITPHVFIRSLQNIDNGVFYENYQQSLAAIYFHVNVPSYMFNRVLNNPLHHHIKLIKRQSCHHVGTSQLICRANQLTGFYMIATLAFN